MRTKEVEAGATDWSRDALVGPSNDDLSDAFKKLNIEEGSGRGGSKGSSRSSSLEPALLLIKVKNQKSTNTTTETEETTEDTTQITVKEIKENTFEDEKIKRPLLIKDVTSSDDHPSLVQSQKKKMTDQQEELSDEENNSLGEENTEATSSAVGSTTPADEVKEGSTKKVYLTRGPCRESRDNYLGNRYSPFSSQNNFQRNIGYEQNELQTQYVDNLQYTISGLTLNTSQLSTRDYIDNDPTFHQSTNFNPTGLSNYSYNVQRQQNDLQSYNNPNSSLNPQNCHPHNNLDNMFLNNNSNNGYATKYQGIQQQKIDTRNLSNLNSSSADVYNQNCSFNSIVSSPAYFNYDQLPSNCSPPGQPTANLSPVNALSGDLYQPNGLESPNYASSPGSVACYPTESSCSPGILSPTEAIGDVNEYSTTLLPSLHQNDHLNNEADFEAIFKTIENITHEKDEPETVPNYHHILNDLNSTSFDETDFQDIVTDGSMAIERLEQQLTLSQDPHNNEDIWNNKLDAEIPKFRLVKTIPSDLNEARTIIKEMCSEPAFTKAVSRIAPQTNEALCVQDEDGDTFLMICISKSSQSPCYYENLYALTERLKQINVCCGQVLDNGSCSRCGQSDASKFCTPLSIKNKIGDTALSCAIKLGQPERVINYMCHSIKCCKRDIEDVFNEDGSKLFIKYTEHYPALLEFL